QMGQITMDNASNCNTMMERIEELCREQNPPIRFHHDGNRLRYVFSYREALVRDPVGLIRRIVADLRASGQRRNAFRRIIRTGNAVKSWPQTSMSGGVLPEVQLLRDCETRWSSTYLMIVRFLTLLPAVRLYVNDFGNQFNTEDFLVIRDIFLILRIAHRTQSVLCGERTPTLAFALPAYEALLEAWRKLKTSLPHLAHYIDVGISKIEEYVNRSRRTRAYALAMILNPQVKFTWLQSHWAHEERNNAREWIFEEV
ncbi:hypothetical protein K474DRAFT_1563241, partial [Panus rudis PR-1116 ss-1]